MRIDLHTHSTESDGTQAPADVVASAREAGLDVLALTDHDTTRGGRPREESRAGGRARLRPGHRDLLPTWWAQHPPPGLPGRSRQPGLGHRTRAGAQVTPDPDGPNGRADGCGRHPDLDRGGASAIGARCDVGRPHLADALVAAGVVPDRAAAFREWLHNDSRYYVSHYAVDPVRAIAFVAAAGGVSVIAHRSRARAAECSTPRWCSRWSMPGSTASRSTTAITTTQRVTLPASIVREHDLIATGSSDYHGAGKLNRLGRTPRRPSSSSGSSQRRRPGLPTAGLSPPQCRRPSDRPRRHGTKVASGGRRARLGPAAFQRVGCRPRRSPKEFTVPRRPGPKAHKPAVIAPSPTRRAGSPRRPRWLPLARPSPSSANACCSSIWTPRPAWTFSLGVDPDAVEDSIHDVLLGQAELGRRHRRVRGRCRSRPEFH